jgi:glycosyltransferase involved in cell wall biosynthesis
MTDTDVSSSVPASEDAPFPEELRGKRVLLATESLGPVNGVSRTTTSLINYLREHDVEVAIVAPKFSGSWLKSKKASDGPEVRLHGYPLPFNPDLVVAYPLRLDKIYRRTFEPDLIYLASPASVGFQFLLQTRQIRNPPPVLLNFQTDLAAYSEIIFPAPLDKYAVWMLNVVQGFLFNHKAVHTIFYPSAGVRRYLENAGAPGDKMIHLGRGVDTKLFDPACRDGDFRKEIAPNGEIILVCVGRIAPEKGFEFLSRVAQQLERRGYDFKLLIVGGNKNPSVEKDVQNLFLPIADRVHFTGFRMGADLARCYASADIFLHCSITETFGLVVLEAMASGLPVVARDEGGPSEIVADQKSGYLVEPQDLEEFTSRTELLMRDVDLRRRMGDTARSMALEKTWTRINSRVAWQLASALKTPADQVSRERPISNSVRYLYSHKRASIFSFLSSAVIAIQLNAAIGIICFFWMVAVLPLLLYGFSKFPERVLNVSSLPNMGIRGRLANDLARSPLKK